MGGVEKTRRVFDHDQSLNPSRYKEWIKLIKVFEYDPHPSGRGEWRRPAGSSTTIKV
jgi:hypothetical protein